ncbi:MAG: hypothetical protein V1867_01480 [Candidatus Falkowbacteria bacterium]
MIPIDLLCVKKILAHKHILVDTNVISCIFRRSPEKYGGLFDLFSEVKCVLCINPFIYNEFIRIAQCGSERQQIKLFLDKLFFNLPVNPEIYQNCEELFPLYNYCGQIKNKSQVSLVDAMNVAFLKKHSTDLFLITHDLSDYPIQLLDRINVGAIDFDIEVITWGIYKFNNDKFNDLKNKFNSK